MARLIYSISSVSTTKPVPYSGSEYITAPTLAGISYSFASSVETCDNCATHVGDGVTITSTTNVTPLLRDYIKIKHLARLKLSDVKLFLKAILESQAQMVHSHGK
jgi:hypothetical protein